MKNAILVRAIATLRGSYTARVYEGETHRDIIAPWLLARTAEISAPGPDEKEGADFLTSLFTDFTYHIENDLDVSENEDAADLRKDIERIEWHETADAAVPVYTHGKWTTFVQLAAYDEDVSDYVDSRRVTPEDCANAALYVVANRLLHALSEELADECDAAETAISEALDAVSE